MEISVDWISGFNIGIEFPPPHDEEVKWNVILDLGILRFVFISYVD